MTDNSKSNPQCPHCDEECVKSAMIGWWICSNYLCEYEHSRVVRDT